MEYDAEALYDTLGKRYQDAYAGCADLHDILRSSIRLLKPHSAILDVGCGTGRPVAEMLVQAGHEVRGIDASEEMVKLARSQVPATFDKVDMRTYTPPRRFDAVFAVWSLINLAPSDLYAMVYKISEWLEEGGLLVLGAPPRASAQYSQGDSNPIWDCVRVASSWMGTTTNKTLLTPDRWRLLLQQAGFAVQSDRLFEYVPNDSEYQKRETHYFVVGSKTNLDPAFGPHPVPTSFHGPCKRDEMAWNALRQRLVIDPGQSQLSDVLSTSSKLLDIGGARQAIPSMTGTTDVEEIPGLGDHLPYANSTFDTAVALLALDFVSNPTQALQELARVVDSNNPNATIVVIQGAPENECVQLMNSQMKGPPIHHGYLQQTARNVLAASGFPNVAVRRAYSYYRFDDSDSARAAQEVAGTWHADEPSLAETLTPHVQRLFDESPGVLKNALSVLIARTG